ncbi:MAG: hypothetical protein ACLFQX_13425, partial [Candidatus Kapaibacterium sp.]
MIMQILITVKAYPAISSKYGEIVCTAGIRDNGEWIRIYPVPFRTLDYDTQFKKYEWIDIDLNKRDHAMDFRPESYNPVDPWNMKIRKLGFIKPDGKSWNKRRSVVLKNKYFDLTRLIDDSKNKNKCVSLA